jgi:hypothetical protein
MMALSRPAARSTHAALAVVITGPVRAIHAGPLDVDGRRKACHDGECFASIAKA